MCAHRYVSGFMDRFSAGRDVLPKKQRLEMRTGLKPQVCPAVYAWFILDSVVMPPDMCNVYVVKISTNTYHLFGLEV